MGTDPIGRVVLVTGASRGIGRAIALAFAGAGADVVGIARSLDALGTLGEEIGRDGGAFRPVGADVTDVGTIRDAVAEAWAWRDRIDVLVNAAGAIVRTDPPSVTADEFDTVFDTNVRGTFFVSQAVGERMLGAAGGAIVNVASIAAEVVTRAAVTYQASKAAIVQMTRALAVRWAPTIRVNAVGPGYIRTDLNTQWLDVEENLRYVHDHTPLGRVGAPADVVGAVLFLASPDASYITGQHLKIDGGWTAR